MKSVIKSIMDKQGISKNELLRQTKMYSTINRALNGKTYRLNERKIRHLQLLYQKPSCKVIPNKESFIVRLNKQEYLNVVACLPKKTQTGLNLYVKKQINNIVVWYQPKTRARSESTFKRLIRLNSYFVACLGLSLGDGLNNPSKRNTHYTFTNTNFQLTYLIFKWLRTIFGLNSNKIQLFLNVPITTKHVPDTKSLERKFHQKIVVYKLDRYRNQTLTLQFSNRIFQCLYSTLFHKLKGTILYGPVLRRAFLKGLFAAEGHVKHSVYGTIESMSFAYNPRIETDLMSFVKSCLKKEQIYAKNDPNGYLYFCGYENMIRFYLLGGLSLYKAKEEKFIRLLKNAELVLHFKNGYLTPLRKHSQNKLAKTLNCSQPAICKALKKGFFPLKHLLKLQNDLDISRSVLIAATEFITVRTSFVRNKEAIKFLLSLIIQCK